MGTCVVDLKLLNKGDFKGLVLWREKMVTSWKQKEKDDNADSDDNSGSDDSGSEDENNNNNDDAGSAGDDDEDEIQKEIRKARERKQRERKKIKKKERKVIAKKRRQSAFGMDLNAIDVQEHDQFFSLAALNSQSSKDLHDVSEVNLDRVTTEQAFGKDSDDDNSDDSDTEHQNIPGKEDTESGYSYRMEKELDMAYDKFIQTTKNSENKVGTKTAKRSKKLLREKMAQQSHEDHELLLNTWGGVSADAKAYVQLLQGPQDSDDDDEELEANNNNEDDDGFNDEPMTPAEHQAKNNKKQKKKDNGTSSSTTAGTGGNNTNTNMNTNTNKNPLIHEFPDDPTPMKTARWFSNPLFAEIGQTVNAATANSNNNGHTNDSSSRDIIDPLVDNDNDEDNRNDAAAEAKASIAIAPSLIPPTSTTLSTKKKKKNTTKPKKETTNDNKTKTKSKEDEKTKAKKITADDVLAMMPRTDKQKRHEKRIKAKERDERRQARKAKKMGEEAGQLQEFDVAPGAVRARAAASESATNDDDY